MLGALLTRPRSDNFDPLRHADGAPMLKPRESARALRALTRRGSGVWGTWEDLVTDKRSRETLLDLAAFRLLGARRVELGLGTAATRRMGAFIDDELVVRRQTTKLDFNDWWANEYDLTPLGIPVRMEVYPLAILHAFLLDQYRSTTMPEANIRPGDVVIDGGACWGNTTLYFAHQVGAHGQVLGFEFVPENLMLFEKNLRLNPQLSERIQIRREALWSSTGDELHFVPNGPATRVAAADAGDGVPTCAIDELVSSNEIPHVDVIKLDVEGAELEVLHGARKTLREQRPRLAIAVYHKPADIYEIPRWIKTQQPSYRFAVEHRTLHGEETMLFAYA